MVLLGLLRGSRRMQLLAGAGALALAADRRLPLPTLPNPSFLSVMNKANRFIVDYFRIQTVYSPKGNRKEKTGLRPSDAFSKDRRYLIGLHPHGFMPIACTGLLDELFKTGFLPSGMGYSAALKIPILGRYLAMTGYVPVTKHAMAEAMNRPFPYNIYTIVPGGIAEMFRARKDCEVVIRKHVGFLKIAMASGSDVVPAYCFGSTQVYNMATGPFARFWERLARKFQIGIPPFSGVWGTPIPFPHPQAVAIGSPIPTEGRELQELAEEYFSELRRLYETHKGLVGWHNRPLYWDGEQPELQDTFEADEFTEYPKLSKL